MSSRLDARINAGIEPFGAAMKAAARLARRRIG